VAVSKTLYSRDSDEYQTPPYLYDFLDGIFHFTLDPCASLQIERQKRINTKVKYTIYDNGLNKNWINYSTFINPPYSQIKRWIDKALYEFDRRLETFSKSQGLMKPSSIVLLVPARTDTKWFHKIADHPYAKVILLKGRLQFDKSKRSKAPFPSCIFVLSSASIFEPLANECLLLPSFTLDIKPQEQQEE